MPTDVSVARFFADLPDPRLDRTKKHALVDVLVIALAATIAGAESFEAIAAFGVAKHDWLARFLTLPNGIPSADTFGRVFGRLDPRAFGQRVADWLAAVCTATGLRHIAVDGKAARRAKRDTFSGCLHLVSAWATEHRLILGQEAVADKSNEITAIPELLAVLDLAGALVTVDAAGCQQDIAAQVRRQGGDYLLAIKGNQPALEAAVQAAFAQAFDTDFAGLDYDEAVQAGRGHGRQEERGVTVLYDPAGLPDGWADVAAVVLVRRERVVNGQATSTAHYYLSSLRGSAAELGQLIRRHWAVENELHWTLDVAFREDANRTREGHAGANLGLVRRVALSLLKQDPGKGSVPTKRLKAAWDEQYLGRVLQGFTKD